MLTIFGSEVRAPILFLSNFEKGAMGRFSKLRKNKKYGYKPRYYDDKGEGNPYKIGHKLDRFRSTADHPGGLKNRFKNAMSDLKREGDRNHRWRMLIIILILLLIVLYILDFDLSIFFPADGPTD
jgi:hypothetical protein